MQVQELKAMLKGKEWGPEKEAHVPMASRWLKRRVHEEIWL